MVSKRIAAALIGALTLLAGCSVPTDDQAVVISPDQLPDVLREDVVTTTTLDPGPLTESIQVFLLSQSGDRAVVVPVSREVDRGSTFAEQIGVLFAGEIRTEEEIDNNWFNSLRDFQLVEAFVNDSQVAIVDLIAVDDAGEQIEIETQVLADAVAQLVYTATGMNQLEPIEAVRIRIGGEAVFLPTFGGDTSDVVDRSDFENYDPEYVPPSTTTPPTTTLSESGAPPATDSEVPDTEQDG